MRVAIFLGCMKNAHIYHICTGHRSSWTCANRFDSDVGQDTMFIIHAQRVCQTTYAQAGVERRNMAICRILNNNTHLLHYHCSLLSSTSRDLFYLLMAPSVRAVYLSDLCQLGYGGCCNIGKRCIGLLIIPAQVLLYPGISPATSGIGDLPYRIGKKIADNGEV